MSSATTPLALGQGLLKRNASLSAEDFRKHYIGRHGPTAIPWFLANGVIYYAQIHRPLAWTSPEAASKHSKTIPDLSAWDAAVELGLPPRMGLEDMDKAQRYYSEVILPDERMTFLTEALQHMTNVGPGSVTGERVEFIVDGKMVVEYEEWKAVFEKYQKEEK
ncbi:hypothetical protein LTR62_006619 [Meristemomyces frigidus]|uniref:EthD domain-containing protein n=1 Tax=Meristemomyces frigidus TaxID=1508187 RepID=A0AAN7YT98_9PEZI|nr:hypothetical protein LTR62_006619 [Meristemomyces frigidus]